MKWLTIVTTLPVLTVLVGCEAAAPPQVGDRSEAAAMAPPEPEAPQEPAKKVDPTAPTGNNAKGRAAIAGAAAALAEQRDVGQDGDGADPAADGEAPMPEQPMPEQPATEDAPAEDAPADDQAAAGPPAEGDTLKKAEVGVGVKGKDYGGPGFVTTPVATMFRARERIALTQMENAMKIYKAAHNNKGPKSHEEFMDVIIKQNAVELPVLPEGDDYWYDVESETLMVRTPKQNAQNS